MNRYIDGIELKNYVRQIIDKREQSGNVPLVDLYTILAHLILKIEEDPIEPELDKEILKYEERYQDFLERYVILKIAHHFYELGIQQILSKSYSESTLIDWYISSIDETLPPIWTEEHIAELCRDFYVVPKNNEK